jgi:hypothetical protein
MPSTYFDRYSLLQWYVRHLKPIAVTITLVLVAYAAWETYWYLRVGSAAIKWHTYAAALGYVLFIVALPVPAMHFLRKHLWLGVLYIVLSLAIGEQHPFTLVPMYTSFINEARVLSLTTANGQPIVLKGKFNVHSGGLMHRYFAKRNAIEASSPNLTEKEQNKIIGSFLIDEITNSSLASCSSDTLQLHLLTYHLHDHELKYASTLIYAKDLNR